MQVIQEFCIKDSSIQFVMPDVKENIYYLPGNELNRSDLVEVIYFDDDRRIKVLDDTFQVALVPLLGRLQMLCKGELNFKSIVFESMGRACNEALSRKITSDEIKNLWRSLVWEYADVSAYMYQLGEYYYFEISPNYPWHFVYPEEGEEFTGFDEYIKDYKPYMVEKIDIATAQHWIKQCEELIEKMT